VTPERPAPGLPLPAAAPAKIGLSAHGLARLGSALQSEVLRGRLPGAVALIARRGRVGYFESFGVRNPADGAPMSNDSLFRMYSMTKPITSVAAMMLCEEGKFLLDDPVARYLPELADLKVAELSSEEEIELVPAERAITILDLLRHTAGITYEFRGRGPVHKMYTSARIQSRSQTNAAQVASLGKLPLLHQPGIRWEYGRSTDVIGRLIEVLSGETLGAFFQRRILGPLGMVDTAFHVQPRDHPRLAEAFAKDPDTGDAVLLQKVREPPMLESGGGGLVSTAGDYARFLQMLLNGGTLEGVRLLGRKTVEFMTADHLGSMTGAPDLLLPGYGFGLGFAVRVSAGIARTPGSVGEYFWGGLAGTTFWVDPGEQLFAILLIQAPGQRAYYAALFRDLVYAAIAD
jgi:CubicO group peptidase (beta-lactamase class C family)